jgi:hypothetical protein
LESIPGPHKHLKVRAWIGGRGEEGTGSNVFHGIRSQTQTKVIAEKLILQGHNCIRCKLFQNYFIIPTLFRKEKVFQNTPIWNEIIPSGNPVAKFIDP